MNIGELIKTSFSALSSNKTRTGLTMLGIIIGIASVISMLSIGNGAQQSIQNSVSQLGSNLLTISAGSQRSGVVQGGAGTSQTLTNDDALAISNSSTLKSQITAVSAEFGRSAQIVANGNNTNTTVNGATPDYAVAHNYQIDQGSFISDENNIMQAKVAVLGPDTANNLFGSTSVIGQTIKINKVPFKIIGITMPKGSSGFQNQDDVIFIPLLTAQKIIFGQSFLRSIVIQGKDADTLTQLQADITTLLASRHKVDPLSPDFTIRNSADTLSTLSSVTGVFTILLAGIASISLIVGGIGIMNIMIVTVTERTKEIGLRKAIGAKNKIILAQFLVEAIVLTVLGGIFGIIIGIIVSQLITSIGSITTVISLSSILLSSGVSILIGIVFGLYPAIKASRLSPIDALRYE